MSFSGALIARLRFASLVWLVSTLLAGVGVHWSVANAQQLVQVPALRERVTDLTGTLTPADKQQLTVQLAQLETSKGSQLAILIVPTTQPEVIEQFSLRVVEQWKIGRGKPPSVGGKAAGGKVNDGVLLLVAKDDRKIRIEVGYGLEGAIPDALAKRVITEQISPRFRQGDFVGGLNAGVAQLSKLIDGEALPPPWTGSESSSGTPDVSEADDFMSLLPFLLFGLMFAVMLLPRLFGRTLGSLIGGAGAGFIASSFAAPLLMIAGAAIITFLAVLLFGGSRSNQGLVRQSRRSSGPIVWGGGTSGGGFGGFGGSGGGGSWGGGGGDFGGGGASGDW